MSTPVAAAKPKKRGLKKMQDKKRIDRRLDGTALASARPAGSPAVNASDASALAAASGSSGPSSTMVEQFGIASTVEETSELPPPPPGVSVSFHHEHHNLAELMHSNEHLSEGVVALAEHIRTLNDAEVFVSLLREWKVARHAFTAEDGTAILAKLFEVGAYDILLRVLCDRPIYRLGPTPDDLVRLLSHFRDAALAVRTDAEAHIRQLDSLYKTFAVVLYHNMVPTIEHYSILITAGAYGNTPEGLRRSAITAREVASLGWKLDEPSVFALAHAYIEQSQFDEAIRTLKETPVADKSIAAILRIRAQIGLGDIAGVANAFEALAALTDLDAAASVGQPSSIFGSEFWVPLSALSEDVATLISSVEVETVHSQRLKKIIGIGREAPAAGQAPSAAAESATASPSTTEPGTNKSQ
ncbi:hypothetical protein HK105_206089 [Polyrhizophydium stewartii]|uniref:Uncharacterized protein n=1 Tax=Polyrhizophydium stewartii TaxID=2732419 RepID=A0ABR4N456_9FUNG|nr:hypothetical protein HK105_006590 [Polyrhizophydium stewartii]